MVYTVTLKLSVIKALERINEPYYTRIKAIIYSLGENLRPPGYKKLNGRDGFRIRVGIYRIIYRIYDSNLVVDIIAVGHRKDIYE